MMRLVLAAAAALCLSACTQTDQSVDGVDDSRLERRLYATVEQYASALTAGDTERAFELLAPECQGRLQKNTWERLQARARTNEGFRLDGYDARIWNDSYADVSYSVPGSLLTPDKERWSYAEADGWKLEC